MPRPTDPADRFRLNRRQFVASSGLAAAGWLWNPRAVAGPFDPADFEKLVPRDKKLRPEWIASLTRRGEPEVFRGSELEFVGFPVGGIGCGQLYLSGDGRLWYWDIFRSATTTDYEGKVWAGAKYAAPVRAQSSLRQGFALEVKQPGQAARFLDRRGFRDVSFRGEYPVGKVTYRDPDCPVEVRLEAFSPFIPLNLADSSLPATVLEYTVRNPGVEPIEVTLAGWIDRPPAPAAPWPPSLRQRKVVREANRTAVVAEVVPTAPARTGEARPEVVIDDFERPEYGGWTATGTAFGRGPFPRRELPDRLQVTGASGDFIVNTHESRHGEDSEAADRHVGRLVSPEFMLERHYLRFRIGGGRHPGKVGLRLLVDGQPVREATGENGIAMRETFFDVREWAGQKARLEVIDDVTGGWGHTTVDRIVQSDEAPQLRPEEVAGWGSLALSVVGPTETAAATAGGVGDRDAASVLRGARGTEGTGDLAAVARTVIVPAGGEATVTFVLAWWFPGYGRVTGEMAAITDMEKLRRHYARRFDSAVAVSDYVVTHLNRLVGETRRWNRTWYDSTLPYWFLDRTFVTLDCLATQTLHGFDNGRWWGWEGVDCCPGTCQHVWQYAQGSARIFPELERDWRERVDFGLAWRANGAMDYRSESGRDVAHDGFCGTLVRVYREHQMSTDGEFLNRLWPRIRGSLEHILAEDKDADGVLEGRQFNTLDAAWHGPMAWISSLFLAALAAGEAMARDMGDAATAERCRTRLEAGRVNLVKQLYNGEYFIHRPPDFKSTNTNDGCHIDQVFGQSLAWQVGLPRVVPEAESRSALAALWRYNFTPDVGRYRDGMKAILPSGRWYAMPGEGGLLMCTWPRGGAEKAAGGGNPTFVGYFIECMTGFEYQVAAHMVWEGMVTEGLAATRMIHDRYAASRRNPYNEIECSDHYSRAMMSYGVFLAACGFEHHGPRGHLGFAPRLSPGDFRCPFTAAGGWGTYRQRRADGAQAHEVEVAWGEVLVHTLAFEVQAGATVRGAEISFRGNAVPVEYRQTGTRVELTLGADAVVGRDQILSVRLTGQGLV